MTLIQLSEQRTYSPATIFAAIMLIFIMVFGVITIIKTQSDIVQMERAVDFMREESAAIQTHNAELQRRILELFDPEYMQGEASARGLLIEKNPYYIKINDSWVFASRY